MKYTLEIEFGVVDVPDFEGTIIAESMEEAIEKFYIELRGEFDKEFIREHIQSEEEERQHYEKMGI